jgi:acetyltransferase-like isoleucine patch superfamily enzyme
VTGDDDGARSLYQRLHGKWQRDRAIPLRSRLEKATTYASDLARARLYLRQADSVAPDVRVVGRPLIRNDGRLTIGDRCYLRSIVGPIELTVGVGAVLTIGPDTHINSATTMCAFRSIELGARVEIAPYVSIYDTNFHQVYDRNALPAPKPVVVEDDVWLCTKSTILPGVRVGRGAIVSAHALVTEDVEPFTVVSGVPAQLVRRLDPSRFVVTPPG